MSVDFLSVLSKRLGIDAADYFTSEIEGEYLIVRPRQYLGTELFGKVMDVVREFDGSYVSAGKKSHFAIPLSKLASSEEKVTPQVGSSVVYLPTDCLFSLPFQARMENGDLNELAESIGELGILEPILVRPKGDGNYEIVCGQRRFKAAVLAGLDKVPCIIREMSDEEAYLAQLTENIQRHDLSDYEKARMLKYLIDKFGYTQEQLAKKIGKTQPWISHHLAILKLETEYNMSRDILEKLTEFQVRQILSAPEDKRKEIIEKIEKGEEIPSAREIEAEVKEVVAPTAPSQPEEVSAQTEEVEVEVEAPPEPKRSVEPYTCSDCKVNTYYPTFLKDGRVLCPTCLQYAWRKGLVKPDDIAEEPPEQSGEKEEIWSPKGPIDMDTGVEVECPECKAVFRLIHVLNSSGKVTHKLEKKEVGE